ncbi:MAG: hypothetical protein Kow002_05220 [Anaerolineales bacterium]
MRQWFRELLFSEHDQDPRFFTLVRIILGVSSIATIAIPISLLAERPYSENPLAVNIVLVIAVLSISCFALTYRGLLWPGKLFLPLAMTIAIPFLAIQSNGMHDSVIALFPVIVVVTALLIGQKIIPFITVITLFSVWTVAYFDMAGITDSILVSQTGIDDIVVVSFGPIVTAAALNGLMNRLNRTLAQVRQNEQAQIQANEELRALQATLEERIAERTNELSLRSTELELANIRNQRRATQFETISQIFSSVRTIRSLDELLPRITELISARFGFYHTGIFLTDSQSRYAVLRAANSEGGKNMLARGHRLMIGQQGIVGTVAATGEPRIAMDVGEDAVYFDNPDLPATRSELALPLKSGDQIIGVLDVQSEQEAAFDDEDVYVLSILADQVSVAIENTRLYDETQRSLTEAETLYRQYLRQAWGRLPKEQRIEGYQYSVGGAKPIQGAKMLQKAKAKKQLQQVAVPIVLRGEPIGILAVEVPEKEKVTTDQMDVIQAVADRVAISVENARLFDETTKRAERERLVSEITTKIRSNTDPDQMIQVALDELKNALGATQVELVPHTAQKNDQPAPDIDTPPSPDQKRGKTAKKKGKQ